MAIIDVIEHPDSRSDEIVYREPQQGSGSSSLDRSSSCAKVRLPSSFATAKPSMSSVLAATPSPPTICRLLSGLVGLAFGGRTPFTAEVYFVSMREFTDLKWGTVQPVVFRDKELGMVRLRAFGTYSMRVADPQLVVQQLVGARGAYTTGLIEDFLRGVIVNEFNDLLGSVQTSMLDLPGQSNELAAAMRNALSDDFRRLGLDLTSFQSPGHHPAR